MPWDLEQTHASLQHTLLEESYEALEALGSGDVDAMVEELGDLLMQVVFHAQIGVDNGTFTMADVARGATEKLVRRHPHMFGEEQVSTAEEVKRRWDQIKAQEREERGQSERSMLDGVPKTMPALAYAQAVQERAARVDMTDRDAPRPALVATELAAVAGAEGPQRAQEQLGEALFSLVNAARDLEIEPEEALRIANRHFYERVCRVEETCRQQGVSLSSLSSAQREELWRDAGGTS